MTGQEIQARALEIAEFVADGELLGRGPKARYTPIVRRTIQACEPGSEKSVMARRGLQGLSVVVLVACCIESQ